MPSRSEPLRRSSRKIKEEPDAEEPSEPPADHPDVARAESPVRIRKVDNEDEEQADIGMGDTAEAGSTSATAPETGEPAMPATANTVPDSPTASTQASQPKTRGTQPAKRFQTRAGIVRKSEAERKKLEKEEEQRRQRQVTEATRGQRGTQRGPRGASRGRGTGATTRGDKAPTSIGADWAFERTASDTPRSSHANEQVLSHLERGEQDTPSVTPAPRDATESTSKGKGRSITKGKEAPQDIPREVEEDINRTDIEHINLISDEEENDDDDVLGTRRRLKHQKSMQDAGLRPIRLKKHEHIKRAVGVAATKLKSEQNMKEEDAHEQADIQKARTVAIEEARDTMQVDQETLGGPSAKREVEIKAPSSPEEHKKPERRRRTSSKDRRLAYETIEEQQERLRYEKELRKISRELSILGSDSGMPDIGSATTSNGSLGSARDGKMYLFQLPPMTPMLVRGDGESDLAINGSIPVTETGGGTADPTVKKEPGTEDVKNASSQASKILTAGEDRLPGGLVGKLNVHQSGKVTLDWGGTSMVVNWGTEVDFLQDAVLMTPKREGQDQVAYSLAQVKDKFVVTPDWQKIYE